MKWLERPLGSLRGYLRYEEKWEQEEIRERLDRVKETLDTPIGNLPFLDV